MGHFSHNCKLTGLPITDGTPVVLIVMKHVGRLHDYSDESLQKYGHTYQCENETTRLKFNPVWFPIHGEYDDYGGMQNIVNDDNTKILEEHYDLTIQQIVDIVTCSRKDDGYSDALKPIKAPITLPKDMLKGEKHFDYYQRKMNDPMPCNGNYPDMSGKKDGDYEGWTVWRKGKKVKATKEEYDADFKLIHDHYARYKKWTETNPDVTDDYGKPQYQERYLDLLSYSGMWVHGEVYDELTVNTKPDAYDRLDLGRPEVLESIGFVEGKKTKDERYNRPFTHGKLTVKTDGRNLDGYVFTLDSFKELAKSVGEEIDFSSIDGKSRVEQMYELLLPKFGKKKKPSEHALNYVKSFSDDRIRKTYDEKGQPNETFKQFKAAFIESILSIFDKKTDEDMAIYHYFLNTARYGSTLVSNPLTEKYIQAASEGKLKYNLVRFWRFDHYMYACGRYYDIVGTSPQDGEHKDVLKVLTTAVNILSKKIDEYDD